ncbi:unnamed protein product [Cochlearia groenlandica]
MVLGLSSTKKRRGGGGGGGGSSSSSISSSVIKVDYMIHIHDIKPWPPSQSLQSLRSVLIQWENGDRNSGTTQVVAPSLGSVIGQGKIEFNQSFKLPLTFLKDPSARTNGSHLFFKNVLDLNLFEPRREKSHQLLATATLDLSHYAVLKHSLTLTAPMNSKRSFRNTTQPVLYLTIQPIDRLRASSSSLNNSKVEATNASGESVSALMSEEYYKEAETETASITDDDISSHSSLTVSSSTNGAFSLPPEEEEHERVTKNSISISHERSQSASERRQGGTADQTLSRSSSVDLSSVFNLQVDIPDSAPNTLVSELEDCANVFITDTKKSSKPVNGSQHDCRETKFVPYQIDDHSEVASPQASGNSQDLMSDQESESIVEKSKKVKSVRSSLDISRSNSRLGLASEKKEAKVYPKSTRDTTLESKVKNLECRVKKLEGELCEAAAIEAALYSVVAEHGSSSTKVHAPARRLLRLYLHACKENHISRRANAAKSVVSSLVLVAKACGNDVPRLTFWLSNTIILREIISDSSAEEELPVSAGPGPRISKAQRKETEKQSSLNWKESSLSKEKIESLGAWDDPQTFITALEKVEAWIFSRVVESIWWQTLTPRMQSSAASTRELDKANGSASKKNCGRSQISVNQEQGDFSLELWKKAFRDAHKRLCPLRATGHECGCLSVPARLIMEQCVARLDVAMFNAILRDSDKNFPTDPVSDPIADSRVLPIPCTTTSFGSGALLKNSVRNWSRWLTDLFGIDDEDGGSSDENTYVDRSFKTFKLLKALSDLMMLPKDMLLNSSVRKEVCPMFGASLIKRVLNNFVPDEFCPDPVPDDVLEALESEEEAGKAMITGYPCTAPPLVYSPPSATLVSTVIGDFGKPQAPQLCRIRSSVTRKAYTSDDELDELSSPLDVVVLQQAGYKKVSNDGREETVRYRLLRECWNE